MSDSRGTVTALKVLKAIVWIVYGLATAAVIVLAFAFFMLAFNANTSSGFVSFIYTWGARFAAPFAGMVAPTKLANGGIISWSALFAIAAYAVLAWIVGAILGSISARIYRDTAHRAVGQTTISETHPLEDGGVVETTTTKAVVAPSAVEQEEAKRLAEEQQRAAAEQAAAQQAAVSPSAAAEQPPVASEPPAAPQEPPQ